MAYVDGDNYVKFDAISDAGQTRDQPARAALGDRRARSRTRRARRPSIAAGVTDIWLRLTKTGTSYTGEYSFDGVTWTAFAGPVTNADGGARTSASSPSAPQAAGQGDRCRSTTSRSTAQDPPASASASRARVTSSTARRSTRRKLERDRPRGRRRSTTWPTAR